MILTLTNQPADAAAVNNNNNNSSSSRNQTNGRRV